MNSVKSSITNPIHNVVIVGQGAIGLLYYHYFNQVNIDVSLKASDQGNQQCSRYYFTPYGTKNSSDYPLIYAQPNNIKQADVIIFCLKSYQVCGAVKQIIKDINSECLVILAHNGLGVYEDIKDLFPSNQRILSLLTTHGCLRSASLTIEHTGQGTSDIGLLSGRLSTSEAFHLKNIFNQALLTTFFHDNIKDKQWLKLAINCVINPITALHNIENGKVNDKAFSDKITKILAEVILIAKREGVKLSQSHLQGVVALVAEATAKNSSSMRCDVLANRPTEVDYINGYIHRLGEFWGIATPENSQLWQKVRALTKTS
jgi:2-dehydropantoate 2-reductase